MTRRIALLAQGFRTTGIRCLLADERGTTIVEAAICLPLIITLMVGAMNYGMWFMAAHSLQQAANEGARASLAALNAAERDAIVNEIVGGGVLDTGTVRSDDVEVSTDLDGNRFTVRVSYDISENPLLTSSVVPLPEGPIVRSATVQLSSI